MHIRKTNSAGCDLEKKLALPKRRPGNLLHAEFMISRNQRLHHRWLVTGHVSLITSSNAFTKQAPSSGENRTLTAALILDSIVVAWARKITRGFSVCRQCGISDGFMNRHHTARDLAQGNEILESILSNMGDAVIVADRDEKFLVFNPAAQRMFGESEKPLRRTGRVCGDSTWRT